MSYSRWSNSFWYTFWGYRPVDAPEETRDNAIFEICDVARFEARQLRENIDQCIAKVEEVMATDYIPPFTKDELKEELLGYIRNFLEDVYDKYQEGESCVNLDDWGVWSLTHRVI